MSLTKTSALQLQWNAFKEQEPNALIAVRLGDFFEFFNADAETVAKELRLTLTQRQGVPMAGFHHCAQFGHFGNLLEKGYRVAIVDTVAAQATGDTRAPLREITEVLLPIGKETK